MQCTLPRGYLRLCGALKISALNFISYYRDHFSLCASCSRDRHYPTFRAEFVEWLYGNGVERSFGCSIMCTCGLYRGLCASPSLWAYWADPNRWYSADLISVSPTQSSAMLFRSFPVVKAWYGVRTSNNAVYQQRSVLYVNTLFVS